LPALTIKSKKEDNSITEVTIIQDEGGRLTEEKEPITIYQPEEEDQATDRDAIFLKKNLPRDTIKVNNEHQKKNP
jgi:hypothetical protein